VILGARGVPRACDRSTAHLFERRRTRLQLFALPQAVTLSNNRKSIAAQQKAGAAATQARKDAQAARRELDAAVAVAVQDDADGEFAREVEAAVQKRGEDIIRPVGREGSGGGAAVTTPTPAVRNKRVRKAAEKWEPPVKGSKRQKKKLILQLNAPWHTRYVSAFITPAIDGTRKVNDTYNRTVNINDVFRPSWENLNAWLYIR
jgi:hypothetical protein